MNAQPLQGELRFDGATYDHARDGARLADQTRLVFDLMKDGRFRTLATVAEQTGAPEASVSARLRDLRKERFGGHTVNREYLGNGLYQYQLLVRETEH
jgi:hypothetical protein